MIDKGSLWSKWDLHVHTPASFQWKGQKLQDQSQEERDLTCKLIIDQMNSIDIVAFGIMDYWTFDGYLALRDYLRRNPNVTTKSLSIKISLFFPRCRAV